MSTLTVSGAGTGLIVQGQRLVIPGVNVLNYMDAPQFAMSREDGEARGADERLSLIVLHTTTGNMPQVLRPGRGPVGDLAERNARYWSTSAREAAAHLIIDWDGQVIQIADLVSKITYHAGNREVNHKSFGIELAIGRDGSLYESQMETLMAILDATTRHPAIPVPRQYATGPWPMPNIGARFRGIISHRDVGNRGVGDCGPVPYQYLQAAGYEALDVSKEAHTTLWKTRQAQLNEWERRENPQAIPLKLDGDPGPATWTLSRKFKRNGQWVTRPND